MCSNNRRAMAALVPASSSGVMWSVKADDTSDVAAGVHVLVALVDLVEGVLPGDQLGELELAGLVERDEPGDVVGGRQTAEEDALDPLLKHRQLEEADGDADLGDVADAGDGQRAGLADG